MVHILNIYGTYIEYIWYICPAFHGLLKVRETEESIKTVWPILKRSINKSAKTRHIVIVKKIYKTTN